jgi:hypothetical protein
MICTVHDIYGYENKENEMGWSCGTYWRENKCVRVLMRKPDGRRPHRRPRRRWTDNIITILRK